jgi:phage terminase small subunit
MPRPRDPKRDQAYELWKNSSGVMKLKDIATKLDVSDSQIRKWKNQDKWDDSLKGNVTKSNSNVTKRGAPKDNRYAAGHGAPKGNQNALGNSGGLGGPIGNDKTVTHGLFRKFLPDDEETREIYDAADEMSPIDALWIKIKIMFTNLIRSQKIMFVRDHDDITSELKKKKTFYSDQMETEEVEYEIQFAWDKQATLLNAQSRAMTTLASMIRQYEEMCRQDDADEEQRMRIEKLKLDVEKLKSDEDEKPTEIVVKRWSRGDS